MSGNQSLVFGKSFAMMLRKELTLDPTHLTIIVQNTASNVISIAKARRDGVMWVWTVDDGVWGRGREVIKSISWSLWAWCSTELWV